MTTGLAQASPRIQPVAQVPSILTTARPLPAVGAATAGAAALEAYKAGALDDQSVRVHLAAVEEAIVGLGEPEIMQELRHAMIGVHELLSDVRAGRPHTAAAGTGPITADDLFGIADASWTRGVAWNAVNCISTVAELWCTPPYVASGAGSPFGTATRIAATEEGKPVHTDPFTIYTPITCDWTRQSSRLEDTARVMTEVNTAFAVGRALWMGDGLAAADDQPTLRRNAKLTPGGTVAQSLDTAVAALLSEYETATGGSGGAVLHIPSIMMVGALGGIPGGGTIAFREGNYYRGALGSLISPGPGYPHGATAQGPAGAGPLQSGSVATSNEVYYGNLINEVWVYVSGPVEYALTGIDVLPRDDEERRNFGRTNTFDVWGTRLGLVRFDPCAIYAAKVTNYAGSQS